MWERLNNFFISNKTVKRFEKLPGCPTRLSGTLDLSLKFSCKAGNTGRGKLGLPKNVDLISLKLNAPVLAHRCRWKTLGLSPNFSILGSCTQADSWSPTVCLNNAPSSPSWTKLMEEFGLTTSFGGFSVHTSAILRATPTFASVASFPAQMHNSLPGKRCPANWLVCFEFTRWI